MYCYSVACQYTIPLSLSPFFFETLPPPNIRVRASRSPRILRALCLHARKPVTPFLVRPTSGAARLLAPGRDEGGKWRERERERGKPESPIRQSGQRTERQELKKTSGLAALLQRRASSVQLRRGARESCMFYISSAIACRGGLVVKLARYLRSKPAQSSQSASQPKPVACALYSSDPLVVQFATFDTSTPTAAVLFGRGADEMSSRAVSVARLAAAPWA